MIRTRSETQMIRPGSCGCLQKRWGVLSKNMIFYIVYGFSHSLLQHRTIVQYYSIIVL